MIIEHNPRIQGPIQPLWKSAVESKRRDWQDTGRTPPFARRGSSGGTPPRNIDMNRMNSPHSVEHGHVHKLECPEHVLDDVDRNMAAHYRYAASPSQVDGEGLPSPPGSVSPVERPRQLEGDGNMTSLGSNSPSPRRIYSPRSSPHRLPPSPRQSQSPPPSLLRDED